MKALLLSLLLAGPAFADGLDESVSFSRNADFYATGATLGADTDGDEKVDLLYPSATVQVNAGDLAPGAVVQQALLYWAGSIPDMDDCGGPSTMDDEVDLTTPGAPSAVRITADACACDAAGAMAYDIQACKADVSQLVQEDGTALAGNWTVAGFDALVDNGSTHNASFAIVLFYSAPNLPSRRLTLYDGLQRMDNDSGTFSLTGLEIDDPPAGELTWYALEGDISGSSDEEVSVAGFPGGGPLVLSDPWNPANNPMNRTINTTTPPQEGVIGVDVDAFDISEALAPGDSRLDVTWTADMDKWWMVFQVVGVNVFHAALASNSSLRWSLLRDENLDGAVGPGDTLRYIAELTNGGDGNAVVDVELPLPPEAMAGSVIGTAGGVDTSSAVVLSVDGVAVPAGDTVIVEFDVIVAQVPDGSEMVAEAEYTLVPEGSLGRLTADPVIIHVDTDGDGIWDAGDPCPEVAGDCDGSADGGDLDGDSGRAPPRQTGCGCSSGGAPGWGLLLLPLLALVRRRGLTPSEPAPTVRDVSSTRTSEHHHHHHPVRGWRV